MKRALLLLLMSALLAAAGLPPAAAQDTEFDIVVGSDPGAPPPAPPTAEVTAVAPPSAGVSPAAPPPGPEAVPAGAAEPESDDLTGYDETYGGATDEVAAELPVPADDGGTAEALLAGADRPIAMMVENEPPARPQSGLYAADVVFEIIAEEITRFMAVYYDHTGSMEVGPIRSARDYFADISTMFDAFYCHVGGSPRGLKFIKEHRLDDINAIKGDRGFYRTRDRRIPHNLYTRPASMWEEAARKKFRRVTPKETPFRFLVTPAFAENPYTEITIPYFKSYVVGWKYDPARGVYRRYLNGQPFRAKETEEYHDAENVIIQRIKSRIIDEDLRHEMDLFAGGTAEVLTGGARIVGTWERGPLGDFTYLDEAGREIYLNPGRVWVQFVEPACAVEIK